MKKILLLLVFMLSVFVRTDGTVAAQSDDVYVVCEDMPEFPGGKSALADFLRNNMQYPPEAKSKGIQGRAVLRFIVNTDGTISDIELTRSTGDRLLDQEAVRLVRIMPEWQPGMQRKQPVRVKYTLPVNFQL